MEGTKINESFRKTSLKNAEINLLKDSFVIVPYQTSGFIDISNRGFSNEPVNPDDFETFKRVWTGNDAFIVNWKGSIKMIQQPDNFFKIEHSLGEVFLGLLETNDNEGQINQDVSFSEYKAQQNKTTYIFRVSNIFNINDYYQFMFYKIPELSKSTLFRITNIEKDFVGTKLLGFVITFESLNQDLANSGKARQQNVMPCSPGQGYLECVVKDKNWPKEIGQDKFDKLKVGVDYFRFFDRYITADFQKTLNRPVKKVVIKCLGNGTHTCFVAEGRPVIAGEDFNSFEPQRLLFPIRLEAPETYNFYHTQENTNNLYWMNIRPTLQYYKELMSLIKDSFTPVNQWKYQGFLEYSYDKAKSTNPILPSGGYKNEIFGFLDRTSDPTTLRPWEFNVDEALINTTGLHGCRSVYKIGGTKPIWDHMFDAFWTQKQYKTLPIDIHSSVGFGWTLSSALGAALTGNWYLAAGLFAIGVAGSMISKLMPRPIQTFYTMISAPIVDYNSGLFSDKPNKMPFNVLDCNEDDTPNTIFFSGNTLAIMYEGQLTDKIQSERIKDAQGNKKVLSTINIGQKQDEKGNNLLPDGGDFELNGDVNLVDTYSQYDGYIIDSFKICGVFGGEYSVEFLDNQNQVVWNGVYQSEGKWTKSMREIWTEKDCSVFGRENVFFTEPLPYPKPLPPLIPDYAIGILQSTTIDFYLASVYQMRGGTYWYEDGVSKPNPPTFPGTGVDSKGTENYPKGPVLIKNLPREELLESYQTIEIKLYGGCSYVNEQREIVGSNNITAFNVNVFDFLEKENGEKIWKEVYFSNANKSGDGEVLIGSFIAFIPARGGIQVDCNLRLKSIRLFYDNEKQGLYIESEMIDWSTYYRCFGSGDWPWEIDWFFNPLHKVITVERGATVSAKCGIEKVILYPK